MSTTVMTAPTGWTDRGGLDQVPESTAAKVTEVLAADPVLRQEPAAVTARRVFRTVRGVCLDVTSGKTQAGVHVEDDGGRMELYLTRHDFEPGLRMRTRFDPALAATVLADPHAALLTRHDDYDVEKAPEPVEEPEEEEEEEAA